jgi:thiaminase
MSTFLRRVAEDGDWLSRVAVVAVAEGLYLSWGLRVVDDDVRKVASGLVDRASAERALYAKWVWPLHSSEEFQRAVCAFVEAFNDAWRDADDDSKTRCEAVVREMLDLERAFTELLSSS